MRQIAKYFLLVLILFASALLITNCKSDNEEDNPTAPSVPGHDENLIGKWQLVEAYIPSLNLTVTAEQIGVNLIAEFKADGNYIMTSTDTSGVPEVETGTWKTEKDTLTLKNSDSGEEEKIPYTITGDIGILKSTYEVKPGNELPAEYKFKRVK